MKNYLLLVLAILFFSCSGDPIGDSTYTTVINNSGVDILLQEYTNGFLSRTRGISSGQSSEFNVSSGDAGGPKGPFISLIESNDSILVVYIDKVSIWHSTSENSPVSKNLKLESSYEGGKTSEGIYEFTYTFTTEDFEEALEHGG